MEHRAFLHRVLGCLDGVQHDNMSAKKLDVDDSSSCGILLNMKVIGRACDVPYSRPHR